MKYPTTTSQVETAISVCAQTRDKTMTKRTSNRQNQPLKRVTADVSILPVPEGTTTEIGGCVFPVVGMTSAGGRMIPVIEMMSDERWEQLAREGAERDLQEAACEVTPENIELYYAFLNEMISTNFSGKGSFLVQLSAYIAKKGIH